MPVLLSTRTTKGSIRFNGMSSTSASAPRTAHSHPAAATHHAICGAAAKLRGTVRVPRLGLAEILLQSRSAGLHGVLRTASAQASVRRLPAD